MNFGIVPLEARVSGRPVIAYGRGGALETIIAQDQQGKGEGEAMTDLFFYEQKIDSLIDAVKRFLQIEKEFDPTAIRNHTLQWNREIFKEKIKKHIFETVGSRC